MATDEEVFNRDSFEITDSDSDTVENVAKRPYKEWRNVDLIKALQDVKNNGKSIRAAAKMYNVPVSTLHFKLQGKCHTFAVPGRKTVLSVDEEKELAKWTEKMSKIGYGQSKYQILHKVKMMVSREKRPNPFKNGVLGQRWWSGFLKRNPDVKMKTPESLQIARAKACTPSAMNEWFKSYHLFLTDLNMLYGCADRVWNCDESGFSLCPRTGKAMASSTQKNVLQVTGNIKMQITVLCGVSASGNFIPPFQLYSGTRLTFNPLENGVEGARFALSKSDWMTTEIFYGWLANHFIPCLSPARPVVLLLDGHTSHIDIEISRLCERNQIELFCLPPLASHILQPLDVSVFRSMKCNWKKVVHELLTENSGEVVDKKNFSLVFRKCFVNTISPRTIINGFRSSGIYPLNRYAIDEAKLNPSTWFEKDENGTLLEEPGVLSNNVNVHYFAIEPPEPLALACHKEPQHDNSEAPLVAALSAMEARLSAERLKEFDVMYKEEYDIPDTLYDSWKALRRGRQCLTGQNVKRAFRDEQRPDVFQNFTNDPQDNLSENHNEAQDTPLENHNEAQDTLLENHNEAQDTLMENHNDSQDTLMDVQDESTNMDKAKIADVLEVNGSVLEVIETGSQDDLNQPSKSSGFRDILIYPRKSALKLTKGRNTPKHPQHLTHPQFMAYLEEKELEKRNNEIEKESRRLIRLEKQKKKLESEAETKKGKDSKQVGKKKAKTTDESLAAQPLPVANNGPSRCRTGLKKKRFIPPYRPKRNEV